MAQKHQTSIGGSIDVAAGGTVTMTHRSDGDEWVNYLAYRASGSGVNMNVYIRPTTGSDIRLLTRADDGPDKPQAGNYPIPVPSSDSGQLLTVVRLDRGDELIFEIENTSASARSVTAVASAAGTLEIALSNGGS